MTPTHPNDPAHMTADGIEDDAAAIRKWTHAHPELLRHLSRLGVDWELVPWSDEGGCGFTVDGVEVAGSLERMATELGAVSGPGDALERALDGAVEGWN